MCSNYTEYSKKTHSRMCSNYTEYSKKTHSRMCSNYTECFTGLIAKTHSKK